MATELRFGDWKGHPAITLVAGEHDATFLPECGMLCASLRHRGDEFVAWPRTLSQFLEGRMTAVPFVHPWGNRLERRSLPRRQAHGRPRRRRPPDRSQRPADARQPARRAVRGRPGQGRRAPRPARRPPRLRRPARAPARVPVPARRDDRRRGSTTAACASRRRSSRPGGRAVPVSFCWHPFFQLPGVPRREWELRWPACERVLVDSRVLPTGERVHQPAERAPLAARTFDDHYSLGADRHFALRAPVAASTSASARRIRSRSSTCPSAATSRRSSR